jgi:hypothetical protein
MQNKTRLELADYEAENLAKLQKLLTKKWELIYMQAEAQIKVDKKRDKMERKILDSQERAFWDVHRPAPGCVNTTEVDICKTMRTRRTDYPNIGFFRTSQINNNTSISNINKNSNQNPIAVINNSAILNSPISNNSNTLNTSSNGSILLTSLRQNSTISNNSQTSSSQQQNTSLATVSTSPPLYIQKLSENDEFITLENLKKEREFLKRRLERRYVKTSKVSER